MSFRLTFFLVVVAFGCSNESTNSLVAETSKNEAMVDQQALANEEQILRILSRERPHLSFARFLSQSLGHGPAYGLEELVKELSYDELSEIIKLTKRSNNEVKAILSFQGQSYQNNHSFMKASITHSNQSPVGFSHELAQNTFNYLRDKSLDKIIQTYDQQAAKILRELLPHIANDISTNQPLLASQIEREIQAGNIEKAKESIQKAIEKVELLSRSLGESNLSREDKIVLASMGVLTAALYDSVKENKTFKEVVQTAREIQLGVNELKDRYKEFTILAGSISHQVTILGHNAREFSEKMGNANAGLRDLARLGSRSAPGSSGVHSRRLLDFVNGEIRGGKRVEPDELSDDYRLKAREVSKNLNQSFELLHQSAESLNNIVSVSLRMTELLGVRLPQNVQKALATGQKVLSAISLGKSVLSAYSTGGASAALGLLGGSSMLGGDQTGAQLSEINQKLDVVLQNQKLMLEAQMKTMEMIKDLAIMIDRYHEKEMAALAELRSLNLIQLEMLKENLHRDIRSCEAMISYRLSSIWRDYDFNADSYYSIGQIDLIKQKLRERVVGLDGIRRFLSDSSPDHFNDCARAFNNSFGANFNKKENPLLAIFASGQDEDLLAFKNNTYGPLLTFLRTFIEPHKFSSIPLHIPVRGIEYLENKRSILVNPRIINGSVGHRFLLDEMISVKNLERYVSNLLVMYPYFEIQKSFWSKDLSAIVDEFLEASNVNLFRTRGAFYLQNALAITHSAIAQEALLAGEPLISALYENLHHDLLSDSNCSGLTSYLSGSTGADMICAMRSNSLLMKNYLHYVVSLNKTTNPQIDYDYEIAYKKKDIQALQSFLKTNLHIKEITKNQENVLVLEMSGLRSAGSRVVQISLPRPEEIESGELIYSENMQRLLLIQKKLLDELELNYPKRRNIDPKQLMNLILSPAN
ncbi:MAG: hypothetical protein LW878_11095 [Proteobacteria bacterium]|nr:hypothetical protein [Pseudomonadota bacterium]